MKIAPRGLAWSLLFLAGAAAAQYKYTTPDGRVVYTDQPPPTEARNVQQRDFGGSPSGVDASRLPYEWRRAAENFPVTLYTAPNCPPCDAGKAALNRRGIPFAEKTVTTAEDFDAIETRKLGTTFPVLTVGSAKLSGYNSASWQGALDTAGYPKNPPPPGSLRNPAPTSAAAPKPVQSDAPTSPPAPANAPTEPVAPQNPGGIRF